jgi:hypothetical protein
MEQGLEAPASSGTAWRATETLGSSRRKGEEARFAVNAAVGNGRGGDAGPREGGLAPHPVAVGGGKASKGGRCIAGNPVSRQEETR